MPGPFREVVIGLDGSPTARRAAAFVARMRPPGRATVVQVVEQVRPPSVALMPGRVRGALLASAAELEAARRRRAARATQMAAEGLARAGWRVRTDVRTGVPVEALLAAAKDVGADLVVVGARGTGGITRLLLGSVAEGILKRSPVPTLVVK
jgi:nucleotide-binding universal stress UspA family protein